MKPKKTWNHETHDPTNPMKPQNSWNHETFETKFETYETMKTTKPLKPWNPWNHETYEPTKPLKPQTPWNHETDETSGLWSKLCESTRELENLSRNNLFKLNTEKAKSMFVPGTRLRTKIGGTSVNQMRIFTSKEEELENTTTHKLLGGFIGRDLDQLWWTYWTTI